MRFTEFLSEKVQSHQMSPPPQSYTTKLIISTAFYDAECHLQPIYVEALVSFVDDSIEGIQPERVKYKGHLVEYEKFLGVIPTKNNQALFNVDQYLDAWSTWIGD